MKMIKKFGVLILAAFVINSCSKNEEITPGLNEYDLQVISYFKEIALGFEFGNASEITRKWTTTMKIYVGGTPTSTLTNELYRIMSELNTLATDGFSVEIASDSLESNYYLFFGSGDDYAQINPSASPYVSSNWGLFSIWWNSANQLNYGMMYVDIYRPDEAGQKHLLREELTQSLGLGKDSYLYNESIFQQAWTTTNNYAQIDKDVIRLLYHPQMSIGLDAVQVDEVLRRILLSEK